jgi:DNA mismatch endonuclease (patch repair protein)
MADTHDSATRSYNMSRIKACDTTPEMIVRRFLFSYGIRYRLHSKNLPGKPDIVLTRYKTVIFINGCFWHGHDGCSYFSLPKTRSQWWSEKIQNTVERDKKNKKTLTSDGWNVITVWECDLKKNYRTSTLNKLYELVVKNKIQQK